MAAPIPSRSKDPHELEKILDELIPERPSSAGPKATGAYSQSPRTSRPSSILGIGRTGPEPVNHSSGSPSRAPQVQTASVATQTLSTTPVTTSSEYSPAPLPTKEIPSYSKAIQTSEQWSPRQKNKSSGAFSDTDSDNSRSSARTPRALKRLSRREREREEELRQKLRQEIEEELKAIKDPVQEVATATAQHNFPVRALTNEELNAVTSSNEFLDFVERSSKVIERALDQEYDVLADYALNGLEGVEDDEEEGYGSSRGKKGRRIREVTQFYDERWNKKRMISDLSFSPKA